MKETIKNFFLLLVILFFIALFFWLAKYFGGEGTMNEPPQIVCKYSGDIEECFITAHVHSTLKVFKNNQLISIGYETGNLDRNHTHSQKNINHWHGLIKINKKNKKKEYTFNDLTQFEDFQIKFIPEDFNWNEKFNQKPQKYIVNGKEVESTYAWKAGDNIEIYYE